MEGVSYYPRPPFISGEGSYLSIGGYFPSWYLLYYLRVFQNGLRRGGRYALQGSRISRAALGRSENIKTAIIILMKEKEIIMKKKIAALLAAAALCVSFTGCNGESGESGSVVESSGKTAAEKAEALKAAVPFVDADNNSYESRAVSADQLTDILGVDSADVTEFRSEEHTSEL